MYYVLAAVVGFAVGVVGTMFFGTRIVSKVKTELLAVETRLKTAIQTASSKLPGSTTQPPAA